MCVRIRRTRNAPRGLDDVLMTPPWPNWPARERHDRIKANFWRSDADTVEPARPGRARSDIALAIERHGRSDRRRAWRYQAEWQRRSSGDRFYRRALVRTGSPDLAIAPATSSQR